MPLYSQPLWGDGMFKGFQPHLPCKHCTHAFLSHNAKWGSAFTHNWIDLRNSIGTLQAQYKFEMSSSVKNSFRCAVLHIENRCPSWDKEGSLKWIGFISAQFSSLRSVLALCESS